MKNTYMDLKRNQLYQNAHLVMKALEISDPESMHELQEKVHHFSKPVNPRITILDPQGNVLADSEQHEESMENHSDRPEFKAVVQGGRKMGESVRYSRTLGYNMMYVTIPVYEEGKITGVIRSALSLQNIEKAIRSLWLSLGSALLVTLILSAMIGMRLAKGVTSPIAEMVRVSKRLTEKDYTSRVRTPIKGELGQLASAINVLAASMQKQIEEIQENQTRLTGILHNMVSGVMLVDRSGRIELVNPAMAEMLGEPADAFTGKLHMEAGQSLSLSRLIDQSLKQEAEIRDEIHMFFPEERILDAHLAPYVRETGEMKGIIIVLHDITGIRRLEKMRSEFVANVSHELKTPVTSVKGFAETLLDGAMQDEELCRSFLTIIYNESERLHRLISDLLRLSTIEQDRVPLKIEQIHITDAISHIAEIVKDKVKKKQLNLSLPEPSSLVIEGEKDRLHQIILNLVSNAITYTPDGGSVRIHLADRGSDVELNVSDTGIGIPQKELPRVFERFYRVDKARSRDSGGTGLGLAIVKHLVESHHGSIQVDSKEGAGSTFTVVLPKRQRPAEGEVQ